MNLAEDYFSEKYLFEENRQKISKKENSDAKILFFDRVFRRHHTFSDPVNFIDPTGLDGRCATDEGCHNPINGTPGAGGGGTSSGGKSYTPDQRAVVGLAKQAKKTGVSCDEANTLINWSSEAGLGGGRIDGPHSAPGTGGVDFDHAHVGPVDHIPVK